MNHNSTKIFRLIVLTEASIARLVIEVAIGNKPIVLFANPLFPPFRGSLERLGNALVSWGLAGTIAQISPDLPWEPKFPLEKNLSHGAIDHIIGLIQEEILPDMTQTQFSEYAYPMRKAITDYSEKIKDLFLLVDWLENFLKPEQWLLFGAPNHLDRIYRLYHHKPLPAACRISVVPIRLINFANTLLIFLSGIIWLLACSRPFKPKTKTFRLIADRINRADIYAFHTILDDPIDLLILDRNRQIAKIMQSTNGPFQTALLGDARIGPTRFVALALAMIRDSAWLLIRCSKIDPQLFWRFAATAVKRSRFAAFFSRFRPRFFWGRDDYSLDHVIRNQEVRKVGGVSLGINHGLPLNTFAAPWREVDFDIYYSYGTHLYNHVYHQTWPAGVTIKPVGSLQMKREYRARLTASRPKDIAFFPVVVKPFAETFEEVFRVASHFSDRTVYVKMKPGRSVERMRQYRSLMVQAPANVVAYTESNPYELLLNITYGICFTTLVAEALQFKVKTFNLDMDPSLKHQYYRNFPGLTVDNGNDIIRRIESIEAGTEHYDFTSYNDLIAIDGADIFDVIRSDIGLKMNAEN